ncbi:uncharacterized protein LOC128683004 isoform X2 [Plodia interpunctella]|uniref:uncharacterized protein LOC128683004 isoform X2 n=1 Tax=Plodia interpunctella TaxID=58824 RepID=UPI002367E03E|nr:uncharacterized protein LOC128683004 isoform X2 [Plodia interpunctella]
MDNFIKNIKDKISAKVIDDNTIKEQEVRRVLKNIDPNNELSIEDMTTKLSDISTVPKPTKSKGQEALDVAKSSLGVLQKFASNEEKAPEPPNEDEPCPYVKEDNIFNLCDDFR